MDDNQYTPPLHERLRRHLNSLIRGRGLNVGDRLPSEPELMKRFGASRGTVRKAYDALVHEGLVERRSGKGSFVAGGGRRFENFKIGMVVSSTTLFAPAHNPTNWELCLDFFNGALSAAAAVGASIELVPYAPGMMDVCRHDGFLLMGEFSEFAAFAGKENRPCVAINGDVGPNVAAAVVFNLTKCFREAITYLVDCGFERIAFVGQSDEARFGTFKEVLRERNLTFDPDLFALANIGVVEDGFQATEALFRLNKRIDAVFCVTDLRAVGALEFLAKKDIQVPDDVSVMGFDNLRLTAQTRPPLTTYETPRYDAAKIAVETLLRMAEDSSFKPGVVVKEGKVVVRDSVRLT